MPWTTPTLSTLRTNSRNYIMAALPGADAMIANSVLRVLSDVNAGNASLSLQFIAWLALQLLPITSTDIWLDRWADLYLVNADASKGRKQATFSVGTVTITGQAGVIIPSGTTMLSGSGIMFQTTTQVTVGQAGTVVAPIVALTATSAGNLPGGSGMTIQSAITNVTAAASVVTLAGGTDTETDDQLRVRLLLRLANPPMGGDSQDYVSWALEVPGVTRAWASPNELGIGTITLRFMMDVLRESQGGFPSQDDVNTVAAFINTVRPVTVKDFFVVAPIPFPISFTINNLDPDNQSTFSNIIASVSSMLAAKAAPAFALDGAAQPAQTIYAAWISDAVLQAASVVSFDLVASDFVMPNAGSMAVLGTITRG